MAFRNATHATPRTLEGILARVEPGETVLLEDGIYRGGLRLTRSGTADAPITLRAAGRRAIVDGGAPDGLFVDNASWIAIEGIRFQYAGRAGVYLDAAPERPAERITVRDCVCANNVVWGIVTSHINHLLIERNDTFGATKEHGIYVANSGDDPVVRDNLVHHNVGNGIHINGDPECGGDGVISRALVEGNVIWETGTRGGSAMSVMHVQDSLFRNNLMYHNHSAGFTLFWYAGDMKTQSSKRNRVYNNTVFFREGQGRSCVLMRNGATDNLIRNNVFVGGQRGTIFVEPSCIEGLVMDRNVIANYAGARLFGDRDTHVEAGEGAEYVRPAGEWRAKGFAPKSDAGTEIAVEEWRRHGYDANSAVGEMPVFEGTEAGDFRLAAGSVGIGMGEDLAADVPTDIEGRPRRGAFDCGCYAYTRE